MMITAFTELDLALAAVNRCQVHGFIAMAYMQEIGLKALKKPARSRLF